MKIRRDITKVLGCLILVFSILLIVAASRRDSVDLRSSYPSQDQMLQPSDLFSDFPDIKWTMSLPEVKKAIEKKGGHPGLDRSETELAWDGKFDGMNGRATILFKPDTGLYEIAVIVYAMEKKAVFEHWQEKLAEKHGPATEQSDTSVDTSNVWKLKNGLIIELRQLKDIDSPVVDIHWVKN